MSSRSLDGKRIVVTGGAGFVGSHLSAALADAGATVRVIDDLSAGKREFVDDRCALSVVDVRDHDAVADVFETFDPDLLVHLAAIHFIPYCNSNPQETFEVNVMGTRTVLECAREHADLEAIVFASTAAVYASGGHAHREDEMPGPMDIYGQTKLVGEDLLAQYHRDTGVPCVAARLFNVYGPNETNPHLIPEIFEQVAEGTEEIRLGNLSPERDYVYATDVAEAFVAILRRADSGFRIYNVGSGEQRSVAEVAKTITDAYDLDVPIVQESARVRESDRPHLRASIDKIGAEIDWQPTTDFRTGVSRLRDHLDAQNLIQTA